MAASLASVPELQKNAWPPKLRSRKRLGPQPLQLGVPGVGHVDQLAQLLADRLDHRRRAVAQQVASPAGKQIQVAVPLGVPDVGAFAADQGHGKPAVVGNHVLLEELEDFAELMGRFDWISERRLSSDGHAVLDEHVAATDLLSVLDDFRAHALAGVDFQQQRVPQAAVDDVDLADAAARASPGRPAPWGSCPPRWPRWRSARGPRRR